MKTEEKKVRLAELYAERDEIYRTLSRAPLLNPSAQERQPIPPKQPVYLVYFPLLIAVLALFIVLFKKIAELQFF